MCGIAGIVSLNKEIKKNRIESSLNVIKHRGPDGEGIWHSENLKILFGHRRLSIIDLTETANQPMFDISNNFIIVFNGEIYNYQELRSELISKGIHFKSKSDTEVILESYKMWGQECLNKLNGMFAFSILDRKTNILFCARDRVGEKPFYYSIVNDEFIFCSELKGILASSNFNYKLSFSSLDCFLNEGFVPGSNSILENIHKLDPAHALTLDLKTFNVKKWKYWNLPSISELNNDQNDLLISLEQLLQDSVSKQLVADVPVGVLLSGGIDSSLITAMAVRDRKNISTFTVSFPGNNKFDESSHAKLIANHFGTKHYELVAESSSIDLLPQLAEQFDDPIIDSSIIPTFLVSKLIKNYCSVALGGDGGDELFGGYSHYDKFVKLKDKSEFFPYFFRKYSSSIIYNLMPHGYTGRKWIRAFGENLNFQLPLIANYFDNNERNELINNKIYNKGVADQIRASRIIHSNDLIQRATRTDFFNYLPEDILVKVDRASMLNSLEIRAPFLDYRIVEFAFREVPSSLKSTSENKKILLKKMCTKLLPLNFEQNRKQGFSIPLNNWLKKKEWMDFFADNLLSKDQILFNHSFIESILNNLKGKNMNKFTAEPLFGLLMFELWRKKYNISI